MADSGASFSIDVGVQAAGVDSAATALDRLTDRITGAGDAAPAAVKAFASMGDAAKSAAKASEGASGKVGEMAEGFGKLGGPLGKLGQETFGAASGFKKLQSSLGGAGPYAAVAVAIVAITTAALAATYAIASWAVGLADAARTSALLSDGIAGTVAGGRQLDKTIHDLNSKVPQTREELLSMEDGLRKTGLSGDALSAALEDAATKAALLKYGPDFQKQTLSLSNQALRLKSNIAGIFGGLKIDALLEGFGKIVALFDSTTETGNAMKVLFESLFQPIIDGVAAFLPKVITAFIQFEILVMKAAIAIKPFGSKILLVAEIIGGVLLAALALLAIAVVISFLPFLIAVAVTVAVIAALMWLANAAGNVGAAISTSLGEAWGYVTTKFNAALDYLRSISLSDIGTAMINGLVDGIKSAGGAILTAITGAVQGAIDGAKKLLGIASPSKVFAEIGMHTAAGMAEGVDGHADKVQGSLESMVAPPAVQPGAAPAATASSGGGNTYGPFIFHGVQGAEDAKDMFLAALEGAVAQGGSAVAA